MSRGWFINARANCTDCGKNVACMVPYQGDGSVYVYRRHLDLSGERCENSRCEVHPNDITSEAAGIKRATDLTG